MTDSTRELIENIGSVKIARDTRSETFVTLASHSEFEHIIELIQSEVNKAQLDLLDETEQAIKAEIGASRENLRYSIEHDHSHCTISNWKGCIEGAKFILSDIQEKRKSLKEQK